jgi:hypothetical protein
MSGFSPEQRARLAHKGWYLYGKFCGTDGQGICAESIVLDPIGRGEGEMARELLEYLETRIEALRTDNPKGRLAVTERVRLKRPPADRASSSLAQGHRHRLREALGSAAAAGSLPAARGAGSGLAGVFSARPPASTVLLGR